jgi:hypothetical protein
VATRLGGCESVACLSPAHKSVNLLSKEAKVLGTGFNSLSLRYFTLHYWI